MFRENIVSLEEGLRETFRVIGLTEDDPVLIAVYGAIDSGKTYFIEKIKRKVEPLGLVVVGYGTAPTEHTFRRIKRMEKNINVYLFHCAWYRFDSELYEKLSGHEDPGILARKILDRDVTLEVLIHNPNHTSRYYDPRRDAHLYDMVILNPDSRRKDDYAPTGI